jgi:hypothetical protein
MGYPDRLTRRSVSAVLASLLPFISLHDAKAQSACPDIGLPCKVSAECCTARCRSGVCVEGNMTCAVRTRCQHHWECCGRCKKKRLPRSKGKRKVRRCTTFPVSER